MERIRNEIIEDLRKIPGIGASTAEKLMDELSVKSLDDISKLKVEELAEIQGLGMERAKSIIDYASTASADKVKCTFCDKKISGFEMVTGIKDNHFCTSECRDKWEAKKEESVFLESYTDASPEIVVCVHCGKEVKEPEMISNGDVFCSKKCFERWKFYEERVAVSCEYCDREFTRLKTFAEMREHHFCSIRCKDMWETRNDILLLNCEYCDKEFTRKKELVDKSEHQFCSYSCKERWPTKDHIETVSCEFCGEKFTRKRILIDRSEHRFCSYSCKKAWENLSATLTCDNCSIEFTRKRRFVDESELQFCSYKCMNNWENS